MKAQKLSFVIDRNMAKATSPRLPHFIARPLVSLSLGAVLVPTLACDPETPESAVETHVGTLSGRVDLQARPDLVGSVVTAFHIEHDGKLTEASDKSTSVDASGRYSLRVVTPDTLVDGLIVVARSGDAEGSVLVTRTLHEGGTETQAPIDVETTEEVRVYLRGVALGLSQSAHSRLELRNGLSPKVAIELSRADDEARATVAKALLAGTTAFRISLEDPMEGVSPAQTELYLDRGVEARAELDVALDAHSSGSTLAMDAYALRQSAAEQEAGIPTERLSLAALASAAASRTYVPTLNPEVAAQWLADIELGRVSRAAANVELKAAQAGLNSTDLEALERSRIRLETAVDEARLGPNTAESIAFAMDSYQLESRARIERGLALAQKRALIDVEMDLSGARAELASMLGRLSALQSPLILAQNAANAFGSYESAYHQSEAVETLVGAALSIEASAALVEILMTMTAVVDATTVE